MSDARQPAASARRGLGRFLVKTGGVTVEQALAHAASNLFVINDRVAAWVVAMIEDIEFYAGMDRDPGPPEVVAIELHRLAYEIAAMSATFGRDDLSAAAASLCSLLEVLKATRSWDAPAVDVHCRTLRRLASGGGDNREALAGLTQVVERIRARHRAA